MSLGHCDRSLKTIIVLISVGGIGTKVVVGRLSFTDTGQTGRTFSPVCASGPNGSFSYLPRTDKEAAPSPVSMETDIAIEINGQSTCI